MLLIALCLLASLATAEERSYSITGDDFDTLMAWQRPELQAQLDSFIDCPDCWVTGPLASDRKFTRAPMTWSHETSRFGRVTIICQGDSSHGETKRLLIECYGHVSDGRSPVLPLGYVRFNIWYKHLLYDSIAMPESYRDAVRSYLGQASSGHFDAIPPKAVEYGLPPELDFYPERPPYVIEGYQNYKDFLHSHAEIETEFISGVTAFVPTLETLDRLRKNAPREAFLNRETEKFQEEFREFLERGGQMSILQTLTREGFDTLKAGEYFFAVGMSGRIRFGRELMREEVKRIEEETGHKVPRANHAFLFPGEAILTAGAFFISDCEPGKISKVNAQSGHYFYSNIRPTIREDISEHSNYYLTTLGHFFNALDELAIPYDGIVVSKF